MSVSQVIYGLMAVIAGVVILKFNYQLVGITGRQDWIESKMVSGSTYFAYKIFALALMGGGVLYMAGLGDEFFMWLFSPLRSMFSLGE